MYSIPEKSTNHGQTYAKRRSILLSCVCLRLNAWQEKKHNQTFIHVSDNSSIEGKIGATIAYVLDSIAILRDGHQSILIGSYIPIVYYHHDILIVYTHTHRKLYTHIQWIGLRENLNRKPSIFPFNMGFSCKIFP